MIRKLTSNNIIPYLLQSYKKQKFILKITTWKIICPRNLKLLEFLWQEKWIYGFVLKSDPRSILIYLKYNKLQNTWSFTPLKLYTSVPRLQKYLNWSKNSFYIIANSNGFLTAKNALISRVGGFIFYKIF